MGWNIFGSGTTCGPLNRTLRINEACLDVVSYFDTPLRLFVKNKECFECDFVPQGNSIPPLSTSSIIVDTKYNYDLYFYNGKNKFCNTTSNFEDFGVYTLNVSRTNCSDIEIIKEPEKFWPNIGLSICFYLGIFATLWVSKIVYRKLHLYLSSESVSLRELEMDLGSPDEVSHRKFRIRRQSRIKAIDAFRGIAILLMIFVNYGGGEYTVFKHAPWNGLTIADLVFPWFVWLMGASIVLSLRSRVRTSTSKKKIFIKIVKRTVLLVLLGLILNSGKRYNGYLRLPGVLQRLGITYFVVASIEILIVKPQGNERFGPWFYCQDIMDSWMSWIVVFCITLAHEMLTFKLEVPGCPTGYLGPGGFAEHSKYRNCTGGAAGYIDRLVLTENHMYHHGTFAKIYHPPIPYDPEGILGTLTSILCAFLGAHAARIILSLDTPNYRIRQWLIWGVVTGVAAGLLCNWSQNDGLIPVNKNLWSLSYVLACSSFAFFILIVLYCLIDFIEVWSGSPFIYPGVNAITLYLGHCLLKDQLPWRWVPFTDTHLELLVMDITATCIWGLISFILYKYRIFIAL